MKSWTHRISLARALQNSNKPWTLYGAALVQRAVNYSRSLSSVFEYTLVSCSISNMAPRHPEIECKHIHIHIHPPTETTEPQSSFALSLAAAKRYYLAAAAASRQVSSLLHYTLVLCTTLVKWMFHVRQRKLHSHAWTRKYLFTVSFGVPTPPSARSSFSRFHDQSMQNELNSIRLCSMFVFCQRQRLRPPTPSDMLRPSVFLPFLG